MTRLEQQHVLSALLALALSRTARGERNPDQVIASLVGVLHDTGYLLLLSGPDDDRKVLEAAFAEVEMLGGGV